MKFQRNTIGGWVYILECADGSFYVGSTRNLERRIYQHQNRKGAKHTIRFFPVRLVYFEKFCRIKSAFIRERQIKGWRREKKLALINGFENELIRLAKNYSQHPPIILAR